MGFSWCFACFVSLFVFALPSHADDVNCLNDVNSTRFFTLQPLQRETGLRYGFQMAHEASAWNLRRTGVLKNEVFSPVSLHTSAALLSGQARLAGSPMEGPSGRENKDRWPVTMTMNWQIASLQSEPELIDAPQSEDVSGGVVREQLEWQRGQDLSWTLKNANAVEASWQRRFYALSPSRSPRFFSLEGTFDRVPMIGTNQFLRSVDLGRLQLTEIPLGARGVSFFVLIPKQQIDFLELVARGEVLHGEFWKIAFDRLKDASLENTKVILPKFSIVSGLQLQGPRRLTSAPSFIQQVNVVQMDERGFRTEQASDLEGLGNVIVPVSDQRQVIADLPFFFAIGSREKGLILFVGQVVDPSQ